MAWVPLALLVMPLLWENSAILAGVQVAVVSVVLGLVWALAAKERTVTSLGSIATLTLLILFVDGLGSPLANESVAGPRRGTGGGLGPFFTGAVVACTLVAVGAVLRAVRRSSAARWAVLAVGAGFLVVLSPRAWAARRPSAWPGWPPPSR